MVKRSWEIIKCFELKKSNKSFGMSKLEFYKIGNALVGTLLIKIKYLLIV